MSTGSGPGQRARTTRRALLALGLGSVGALLVGGAATAALGTVTLGSLTFDVPADVHESPASTALGGASWAWRGSRSSATGAFVVLARADLASTDAEEVVGWLLASGLVGALPGLVAQTRRTRTMPGGGEQVRLDVAYAAGPGVPYHGTLLVATRPTGPAGVVLVLGDDRLTAGEVSSVLDSARWVS